MIRPRAVACIGIAGFVAGLLLGSCRPPDARVGGADASEVRDMERDVDKILAGFARLIADREGIVPSDLYGELVKGGFVDSFRSFIIHEGTVPVFEPLWLPAKLNASLQKNAKIILFILRGPNGQQWIGFCDGTWMKYAASETRVVSDLISTRDSLLRKAGYPNWRTVSERDAWIKANEKTLVWDDNLRIYRIK
jgi:hypothetical protein